MQTRIAVALATALLLPAAIASAENAATDKHAGKHAAGMTAADRQAADKHAGDMMAADKHAAGMKPTGQHTSSSMTAQQHAAAMAAPQVPVKTEAEAIAALMGVNEHEVRSSQLAQTKGVSPAVLDYANMMVKEHTDNQTKTASLVKTQRMQPSETAGIKAMKSKKQAERDALSQIAPAKFEEAYLRAMVKDHAEVLAKLDKELIPTAKNAALGQHLRDTRTHVAMHLEKARQLAGAKNVNLDE